MKIALYDKLRINEYISPQQTESTGMHKGIEWTAERNLCLPAPLTDKDNALEYRFCTEKWHVMPCHCYPCKLKPFKGILKTILVKIRLIKYQFTSI